MNILQPSIRIILITLSLIFSGCASDDEHLKDALDQGQMTHSLQEADGYTAPEGSLIINNDNVSTNLTSVLVSLRAQDAVSVDKYFLSDNLSTPKVNSSGWISIGSEGEWSLDTTSSLSHVEGPQNLYVWFLDQANNISSRISDSIIYDITPPSSASVSLSSGKDSTNLRNESFSIAAKDIVGVISHYLSESSIKPNLGNPDWSDTTSTTSFSGTSLFTLSSGEGTKTVYAWFHDFAGNISNAVSTSFTLDQTSPTGSVSINGGASSTTSTSVTLTLSSKDSNGVNGYYVSTDSNTPTLNSSGWVSFSKTPNFSRNISFKLNSNCGSQNAYAWYRDEAGNISSSYNDSISLNTSCLYDFEGGYISSDFTNNYPSWSIDSSTSYLGNNSIRSYSGSYSSSCIKITNIVSGTVSFYYKIYSSSSYSYNDLYFKVNGYTRSYLDNTYWTYHSRNVDAGSEIEWCYNDSNYRTEYALIDNIQIPGRDSLSPTGSISINNKSNYNRYSSYISVYLSAADAYGIIAYYLSSYNTTPSTYSSWTTISKTTSFNSNISKYIYLGYGTKLYLCVVQRYWRKHLTKI